MNYLKKNIPLLCFVVLTIIVALAVTVLDVQTYLGYMEAQEEISRCMDEINSNSKRKPSYGVDNLNAIQADIVELKKRLFEVQSRYGKIHRKALKVFATEIGTTEAALLRRFNEFHESLPDEEKADDSGAKDKKIFDKFIELFYTTEKEDENGEKKIVVDEEKKKHVDAACEEFYKYVRKEYVEYRRVQENEYKCLLEALGLPVTDRLGNLRNILEGNNTEWGAIIPGFKDIASVEEQEKVLKQLLVTYDALSIEQLGLAYRQIQIKQDIYKRMTAAGIGKVENLILQSSAKGEDMFGMQVNSNTAKADPLQGNKKGSYLYYTYEIKVTGTMASIRAFLNSLSEAYKDNRIYNVRNVSLSREIESEKPDNIKKVFGENVTSVSNEGKISDKYGLTLIGRNPSVECVLVVDYIMYVDDMIQRKKIEMQR